MFAIFQGLKKLSGRIMMDKPKLAGPVFSVKKRRDPLWQFRYGASNSVGGKSVTVKET